MMLVVLARRYDWRLDDPNERFRTFPIVSEW